jgi:hypothetical protein
MSVKEKKVSFVETVPTTLSILVSDVPQVDLSKPEDFLYFVSKLSPQYVFWHVDPSLQGFAGVVHEGVMIGTKIDGYSDYSELVSGFSLGFQNGNEYRKSLEIGTHDYQEFANFLVSGFSTVEEFRDVQTSELPQIYEKWISLKQNLLPKGQSVAFTNLSEFTQNGVLEQAGFENLNASEIIEILQAGFCFYEDYVTAREMGFSYASDYFQAMQYGIYSVAEFDEFSRSGVTSKTYWELYKQETEQAKNEGFKNILGKFLYDFYCTGTTTSKWAVTEIQRQLSSKIIYRFQITNGLLYELANKNDIRTLTALTKHPDIIHLVVPANNGKEIARRQLTSEETLVANLDLCNIVLHGIDRNAEEKKGDVTKVLKIIQRLRDLNVQVINVFADASYVFYLGKSEIKKFKDLVDLFVPVKRGFSADAYILDFAQNNPSFIVTNDHFAEHRSEKNPWIYDNIPRLLVGFSFDEQGNVSFGGKEPELMTN